MARYPRRFGSPAARAQSRAAFTAMGGFLPVLGAALSSVIESNTVTLSGLVGSPALTISGGQYSKNGAAYSSAATTVTNGDTLKLRVTSSATAGATASVVATIDGSPRTFAVTTAAATGTPTPPPGPVLANLPQVANTQFATNANETWWLDQATINPAQTHAVKGFADNTGLIGWAEFTLATSTKVPTDTRISEIPATVLADEHDGAPCKFASNGALWVAVTAHSNAKDGTAASNARILFGYSASGRLADLQVLYPFQLSGSTTTAGANYGFWFEKPDGTMIFFTNQDADASWGWIGFPSGDYKQPIEYIRVSKGRPSGGGGDNQAYYHPALINSNLVEMNFQPHASNARNIIQSFDMNMTTGEVTGAGGQSFGSAFQPYVAGAALINLGALSGTSTLGNIKPGGDPGVGRSIRLMDAFGRGFGGAVFNSGDGGAANHFWAEGSTVVDLGPTGPALDAARRYFRGLKHAREPLSNGARRWYRAYADGQTNYAVRMESPALGSAATSYVLYSSTTNIVARCFAFDRATTAMSVVFTIGPRYTSYTSYDLGMQVFASTDGVAAAPSVAISGAQAKSEGNSGPNLYTYTVTRSGTTAGVINVPWTFAAGTTDAADYTGGTIPSGGAVTIADGSATGTFNISVNGDTIFEGDETFTVSITAPSGYTLGTASATGTVLNDDTQTVSPPNTVIVSAPFDNATGADMDLAAYTSPTGGGWTNISATGQAFVSAASGRVRKGGNVTGGHTAYRTNTPPTSANYDVEVDLSLPTVQSAFIMVRAGATSNDLVGVGYSTSSGWLIGHRSNGSNFANINNTSFTASAGSSFKLKLQVRGNVLTLLVDSGSGFEQKVTATTTISYGSNAGVNFASTGFAGSDTVGPQFDNFKITDNVT